MRLSETNLKETCGYFVDQYRRVAKTDADGSQYREARAKLSGISVLLIGFKEKRHVDAAIGQLDAHFGKVNQTRLPQ